MSSLVTARERSVIGKITRSGLDTRKSRPPASTIAASDAAMPRSCTAKTRGHRGHPSRCDRLDGSGGGGDAGAAPASLLCMGADDGLPRIAFASEAEWEEWLEDNHAVSEGVWIKMAKKDAGIDSVSYPGVLESALCFGWIDGRREALDERYFLQRFTPRRSRSRWSRINREKAERLIAAGRMRVAGLAEVQRARADGRWEAAYAGQKSITVPDDLQRELD